MTSGYGLSPNRRRNSAQRDRGPQIGDSQPLKRDRRAAVVVLSAIAAMLLAAVAVVLVLTGGTQGRGTALYWLVMLPLAYWATQLAAYAPTALRWLRATTWLAPFLSGAALGLSLRFAPPATAACGVLFAACAVATAISLFAFRGSLLERASTNGRPDP